MPKDKIPNKGELRGGRRYTRQNMDKAMRGSIERALVELTTNSDDSYRDLEDSEKQVSGIARKITIEIERKKRKPSIVRVRDRASGMSREEMYYKLCTLGERTSGHEKGKARRGLHGRGARDVVAFGTVHFECIKDVEYNHLIIPPSLNWYFKESRAKKATQEIRKKLGIPRGNGTVVTIEVESRVKIRHHETLVKDFSRYYSLRDIFSNSSRKVIIVDLNKKENGGDRLIYRYPKGEIVFNNHISIPNYVEAQAHLIIRKHATPFERDYSSPYREGISVKSAAAIHACTYFDLESESFAWRFSGEMCCEFIDKLVREYDNREEANPDNPNHPENNPTRLLDPFRDGLIPEHPFTEALYKKCKEILQNKINELKAVEEPHKRDVSDESLDRKLDRLSKEISKVFEKKLIELEEEFPTEDIDDPRIKKLGVGLHIFPPEEQPIIVNQPKTFSIIVKAYEVLDESLPIKVISSNPDKVKLRLSPVFLKKLTEDEKVGRTTFTVKSSQVGEEAYIEAYYGSYNNSVHVRVIEQPPHPGLPNGLSFDKPLYHVRINKEKTLILWLKISSKVDKLIIAEIYSDHPEIVVKGGGKCVLRATDVQGVLRGKIKVLGRQLKVKGTLTARVNGFEEAKTRILVEESEPKSGVKLKFDPVEEDFLIVRYKWDEKDPHLLLIGAKHPSIRRYLGEPIGNNYQNIDSPLYHTVLAEVIAEALAFKLLEKHFKSEYQLDYAATEYRYHKHLSDFLLITHNSLVAGPIEK